ncbi:MAG: hypothetical protein ACTSVK_16480 [Promethearchaeota archaeon]
MTNYYSYKGSLPESQFNDLVNNLFDNPFLYFESFNFVNIDQYSSINSDVIKGIIFDKLNSIQFFVDYHFDNTSIIHFFLISKNKLDLSKYSDISQEPNISISEIGTNNYIIDTSKLQTQINLNDIQFVKLLIKKEIQYINNYNNTSPLIDSIQTFLLFKK